MRMAIQIRRLGPGDEAVLQQLAADEPEFDVAGRSEPAEPVSRADAAAYLADPAVLHWVAEDDGLVVGDLLCYVERRSTKRPRDLLLYEIGVRESYRRQGIGTTLLEVMRKWMEDESVEEVWVLADNPEAEKFYASFGFARDEGQPVQMTLSLRAE
jgi:GNAT superfamily N-acetyltransferase